MKTFVIRYITDPIKLATIEADYAFSKPGQVVFTKRNSQGSDSTVAVVEMQPGMIVQEEKNLRKELQEDVNLMKAALSPPTIFGSGGIDSPPPVFGGGNIVSRSLNVIGCTSGRIDSSKENQANTPKEKYQGVRGKNGYTDRNDF